MADDLKFLQVRKAVFLKHRFFATKTSSKFPLFLSEHADVEVAFYFHTLRASLFVFRFHNSCILGKLY